MKVIAWLSVVMAVPTPEQSVAGLVEYPYSGSTWLRFLLAAAVGLPTCSEYKELQNTCEVLTDTFCPCTEEDLAHLSPRGWSTVKEAALETCNKTPVTRPVEYVRGAQVHVWSGSEPVLVKKTHVRVLQDRCHPLNHPVPASFQYDSFVWLIRHPVDVLASAVRISQSEARPLGSHRVEKLNNFYWNTERLRKFFSNPVMVIQYERLCSDTVGSLVLISQFLKTGMVSPGTVWDMLSNYPELRCRHAGRRVPRPESSDLLRGLSIDVRRVSIAVGIWERYSQTLVCNKNCGSRRQGDPCPNQVVRARAVADPLLGL